MDMNNKLNTKYTDFIEMSPTSPNFPPAQAILYAPRNTKVLLFPSQNYFPLKPKIRKKNNILCLHKLLPGTPPIKYE